MRSRNIKPGFFKNDILAEIDPLGRILFTGLWCMADREGRLENRPKKIKAEVLPYDNCNMTKLLRDLEERKFIIQYSSNGCNYIQIVNFLKHQTPHIKESESTIPAPDLSDSSTSKESLIPDSFNLIPDTSIPHPKPETKNGFNLFWQSYPKKKGKGAAEKAFLTAKKQPNFNLQAVILSIEQHKKSQDWLKDNGQFIPFPATWLNQKRWEDEITGSHPAKQKKCCQHYSRDAVITFMGQDLCQECYDFRLKLRKESELKNKQLEAAP